MKHVAVLIAAIVLKLKSEILSPVKTSETEYFPDQTQLSDGLDWIREQLSEVELKSPIQRKVRRKVTLEELVSALQKAMKVKDKKERIKRKLGKRIRREIGDEKDIELRINELMSGIDDLLLKLKTDKVEFSKIVEKWDREEIIKHFMPLLHLSNRGKVDAEQQDFFEEIFISKR